MFSRTMETAVSTIKALRASGVIVQVEPDIFLAILAKIEVPVIVKAQNKAFFSETYQYLTNYRGFTIFTEAKQPLQLPHAVELIEVERIWIPNF